MTMPPPADAGRGMRKAGKIVGIVGGIILVLSVVGGIILGVVGIGGTVSEVSDGEVISGTGQVSLQTDDERQLYKHQGDPTPSCTIRAPSGGEPGPGPSHSSSITSNSDSWTSFRGFTAEEAGDYTVTCDGEVLVAPPLSISGILTGVGGILLAVFGGLGGLALVIGGLILYLVGRSRRQRPA